MKSSPKFELQKYRGAATRHTCPNCCQPRQFVRYINVETGEHLAADVGICNRSSKCGYHRTPRQFFIDNPRNAVASSRSAPHVQTAKPRPPVTPSTYILPPEHFIKSLGNYEQNNFVKFLLTRFGSETVEQAIDRFGIGTASGGRTIFWQIDRKGRVRTGKIILFDPQSGRRSKNVSPDWTHAALRRQRLLPPEFELRQCFFGLHQMPDAPRKTVGVVEAEKTAVIASICLPGLVWLASGGKQRLSPERLEQLERPVTLFPDADAFTAWSRIAAEARRQCFDVEISDFIQRHTTAEQRAAGYDLADFLLEPDHATPEGADFLPALLSLLENLTADEHEAVVGQLEGRIGALTAAGMNQQEAHDRARRDLYPLWQERYSARRVRNDAV